LARALTSPAAALRSDLEVMISGKIREFMVREYKLK